MSSLAFLVTELQVRILLHVVYDWRWNTDRMNSHYLAKQGGNIQMFARLVFRGLVSVTIHPTADIPIPGRLRSSLPGAEVLTDGLNGILVAVLVDMNG